jgi:hypothetical protein
MATTAGRGFAGVPLPGVRFPTGRREVYASVELGASTGVFSPGCQLRIWTDVNRRRIEFRTLDASQPSGRTAFSRADSG